MAHHRSLAPFLLALALLLAFIPTQPVRAAVFSVNATLDSIDANPGNGVCADSMGRCTLRAAVMEANAYPGADSIIIPPGTFTLTIAGRDENDSRTGDLDITGPLTITASSGSPANTIIQAGTDNHNGIDKVMSINPYWDAAFATTLQNLTIRYGYNTSPSSGDGYGGGVDWDASGAGRLTIENCVIADNTTLNADGGGLATFNADYGGTYSQILVTITGSTFRDNFTSRGNGGGISMGNNLPFNITGSVISNNSAGNGVDDGVGRGGGIAIYGVFGASTIASSTISGNSAVGPNTPSLTGSGGGIYANGTANIGGITQPGYVRIHNTTISGNSASGYGGGGLLDGVELNNVTITANRSNSAGYGYGAGGGIHSSSSTATYLRNAIVAGNFNGAATAVDDLSGYYTAGQSYNNLIGTGGSGGLVNGSNGNQVGIANPRLGPLANNSGPTQTHALLPGSPALDAGNNTYAAGTVDQRGITRILDAADTGAVRTVDIGAFEAHPIIAEIQDQIIPANTSRQIEFAFGDSAQGSVTFGATSSNPALVPNTPANLYLYNGSTSSTRSISISPLTNQTGATTITVTASVAGGGTVSDTFQVSVIHAPDLSVTKTHAADFTAGQLGAVFTLTVSNPGLGASAGTVTLTDNLPAEDLTATAITGAGWACSLATLTCTRADALAPGASYPPVTLTVNVSPTAPATLTNTVVVTSTLDTNPANNTASDTVNILPPVDLTLTKTHAGSFRQGQVGAIYTLTASNVGDGSTSGTVTLADILPEGLTATAISGPGWMCNLNGLTCTRADALAAGASYPPVSVTVDVSAGAPQSLVNSATVTVGGDANSANNTASDPTHITPVADLSVAVSHSGDFRQGQQNAAIRLVVSNSGAGQTVGEVNLSIILPAEMTFAGLSGGGWTCASNPLSCTRSSALASGASYPAVSLNVNISANAPSPLALGALVSGGGELNTANDTGSDNITIIPVADLTVTKTHPGNLIRGQNGAVFTLTVTNSGSGVTSALVILRDLLPAGLTATELSGSGWACDLATLNCARGDALAAGMAYPPVTVTVNVHASAPETISNQAQVEGGGELNTANNSASDNATILSLPDLVVSKSHAGNFRQGQAGALYQIEVGNSGYAATTGLVRVVDTLPQGLSAVDMQGSGWNCVRATLTCTRSDALVANMAYPPILLTVDVANDAPLSLTNSVTVSVDGEMTTDNNTAADITAVTPAADVVVSKNHTENFRQGQTGAVYTLLVSNLGPGATNAPVLLEEQLPAGMALTGLAGPGWNCDIVASNCQRADTLAAGVSYPPVTVTVNVTADAPGSLTNKAQVSGGGQVNNANDTAADLTRIYTRPVITAHPLPKSIWAGQMVIFSAASSGDPAATVQWQESRDAGATWADLEGETGHNLTFTGLAEMDNRQYRAIFTNELGSAETNAAALTINLPPFFVEHPHSQTARAGQQVTLRVVVSARPQASIFWQVSSDNGLTWQVLPGQDGPELVLRAYLQQHGYQYRAGASNDGGTVFSDPAVLAVEQNGLFFPLAQGR